MRLAATSACDLCPWCVAAVQSVRPCRIVADSPLDRLCVAFGLPSTSPLWHHQGTAIAAPTDDTGPQVGADRPGSDMAGYPKPLPSADPNLCWKACNETAGCEAWAYGMPNCGGGSSQPLCWLKSSRPGVTANKCRVSGAQVGAPTVCSVGSTGMQGETCC